MSLCSVVLGEPRVSLCGAGAVLFEAEGQLSLAAQERIWNLADRVSDWPGALDVQPGMNNLLVLFDTSSVEPDAFAALLLAAWGETSAGGRMGKSFEFGVVYGGERGADLRELADLRGFDIDTVARLHAAREYVVFAPGVAPGFGYLYGLDERLFTPRRQVPVGRDLDGYVGIGGDQASLGNPRPAGRPVTMIPTGWYVIGRAEGLPTPFDPARVPPNLVAVGDRIRFRIAGIQA